MSTVFLGASSQIQYAPWRAYLEAVTPNPEYAEGPYIGDKVPDTFINDGTDTFYFDAIIRLEHNESRRITEHPVQTGANISDHSFQLPARLVLEIGMSDVMASYKDGQFGSDSSYPKRSVQAYHKFQEWQQFGLPLSVYTRLNDYSNMVIENISAPDDVKTKYGLKAMVSFKEIITQQIKTVKTSAIKHANVTTPEAIKQTQDPGTLLNYLFGG